MNSETPVNGSAAPPEPPAAPEAATDMDQHAAVGADQHAAPGVDQHAAQDMHQHVDLDEDRHVDPYAVTDVRAQSVNGRGVSAADPILVEIVEGTLASVEKEVETAIARTARSPMIRDAHDFRAGIHDVRLRKLTGRSYSALVQPIVRDFMLATFGGSGSLLACRLVDILDLAGVVVPPNPGNVSAFGLLTVDVKNDYVQPAVAKPANLDHRSVDATFAQLTERAAKALDDEGFARADHRYVRTADLRYFGQAFEVRVNAPEGAIDEAVADAVATAFHDAHKGLYGYDFRDDPRQQVEWVNLRVTGIGPITRPEINEIAAAAGQSDSPERARTGTRPVCFEPAEGYVDTGVYWRPDLRAGDEVAGPVIVEEFGSTVPVHPGFTVRVDAYGNLVITKESGK